MAPFVRRAQSPPEESGRAEFALVPAAAEAKEVGAIAESGRCGRGYRGCVGGVCREVVWSSVECRVVEAKRFSAWVGASGRKWSKDVQVR